MALYTHNNISTPSSLASGITNVALSFTVQTGHGATYPSGRQKVLIEDEIVDVSSRTGDVFTIISGGRGYGGTTAVSHLADARVDLVVTSEDYVALLDSAGGFYVQDSLFMGGNNIYNVPVIQSVNPGTMALSAYGGLTLQSIPTGAAGSANIYINDSGGTSRLRQQFSSGDILFLDETAAAALRWDQSAGYWDFSKPTLQTRDQVVSSNRPQANLSNGTWFYRNGIGTSIAQTGFTGTFAIKVPSNETAMSHFRIHIYNYSGTGAVTLTLGGYTYVVGSYWVNTTAAGTGNVFSGSVDLSEVRFVNLNGTPDDWYILLGDSTTSWSYPKIMVEALQGHAGTVLSAFDIVFFEAGVTDEPTWDSVTTRQVNDNSYAYSLTIGVGDLNLSNNSIIGPLDPTLGTHVGDRDYNDLRYAALASGVTNGNTHDHLGGDGAQIDHGGLAGLGDDDHTQYHTDARAVTWIGTRDLSDVGDVTLTAIASGELLKWNGTIWINNTLAEAGISATGHVHDHGTNTGLGDDDHTQYHTDARAVTWIGTRDLSDVGDVTLTAIASGELLKWNGTIWINNTLAEAGISDTSHTHTHASTTGRTANDHHNQIHTLTGADHTVSGLTTGHVLQATGATTFGFAAIPSHNIVSGHSASGLTTGHVLTATGATTFAFQAATGGDHPDGDHDHGGLVGLGDDDHTIYHTDARAVTWIGTRDLSDVGDVTLTAIASGELLKWNGTIWINNTLAEAGISGTGHAHSEYFPIDGATPFGGTLNLNSNTITGVPVIRPAFGTDITIQDGDWVNRIKIWDATNDGDITFYKADGTSKAMEWDESGGTLNLNSNTITGVESIFFPSSAFDWHFETIGDALFLEYNSVTRMMWYADGSMRFADNSVNNLFEYINSTATWEFRRTVDLNNNVLLAPLDPTLGTHVGDRDYNDARYFLTTGHVQLDYLKDLEWANDVGGNDIWRMSTNGTYFGLEFYDSSVPNTVELMNFWEWNTGTGVDGDFQLNSSSGFVLLSYDHSAQLMTQPRVTTFSNTVSFTSKITGATRFVDNITTGDTGETQLRLTQEAGSFTLAVGNNSNVFMNRIRLFASDSGSSPNMIQLIDNSSSYFFMYDPALQEVWLKRPYRQQDAQALTTKQFRNIHVASTAPGSPLTGDVWIDTT